MRPHSRCAASAKREGPSLAEAVLYAANKGAAEALGIQSVADDSDEARIVLNVDSRAAIWQP